MFVEMDNLATKPLSRDDDVVAKLAISICKSEETRIKNSFYNMVIYYYDLLGLVGGRLGSQPLRR